MTAYNAFGALSLEATQQEALTALDVHTDKLVNIDVSTDAAADALGAAADAKVDTDATGTISAKLRGVVSLLVNLLSRWPAALGAGGGLKVDGSGTALPISGTVTVTDGSGPLSVDGTVTANQGTSPWIVSGQDQKAEDSAHTSGQAGSFVLGVRNDANAVQTSTDGDYSPISVTSAGAVNVADGGGSLTVDVAGSATGATTSVSGATSATTLKASNSARRGLTVYNDSTALLYLLLGAGTVSSTVYSVQVPAGGYYEAPFGFTGAVTGIWTAATGNARVTEITA